jgi:ABC-2 type transport system ATP-binding protein
MNALALEVRGLVVRDEGGSGAAVYGADLVRARGITAILGAPEDGLVALFDAITGRVAPERGTVRVAGHEPFEVPTTRARVGALRPHPDAWPRGSVVAWLELATSAWPKAPSPKEVLVGLALDALAARSVDSLSTGELRAIELALALATPDPAVIALYEPTFEIAGVDLASLEVRLAELAQTAVVVIFTSSARDARRHDDLLVLHRGVLGQRSSGLHEGLVSGVAVASTIAVAEGARALAAALAAHAEVHAIDANLEPAVPGSVASLVVTGADPDRLALAVADAVAATGAVVLSVEHAAPTLQAVRATSDALVAARFTATLGGPSSPATAAPNFADWSARPSPQATSPAPAPPAAPAPPRGDNAP